MNNLINFNVTLLSLYPKKIEIIIDPDNLNYIKPGSKYWDFYPIIDNKIVINKIYDVSYTKGVHKNVLDKFLLCCALIENYSSQGEVVYFDRLNLLQSVIKNYLNIDYIEYTWLSNMIQTIKKNFKLDDINLTINEKYEQLISLKEYAYRTSIKPNLRIGFNEELLDLELIFDIFESEKTLTNFLFNTNSYYLIGNEFCNIDKLDIVGKFIIHLDNPIGDVEIPLVNNLLGLGRIGYVNNGLPLTELLNNISFDLDHNLLFGKNFGDLIFNGLAYENKLYWVHPSILSMNPSEYVTEEPTFITVPKSHYLTREFEIITNEFGKII